MGESKEQIWYNQYSVSAYEKESETSQLFGPKDPEQIKKDQNPELVDQLEGSVVVERRRVSGQFWQTLDLKSFPADVQHLTITLTTPKQANEIKITHCKDKASSVNTKCFVDSQCWR